MDDDALEPSKTVHVSRQKLQNLAESLRNWVTEEALVQQPCVTKAEYVNYRCKCSFQIVWVESILHFATRHNQMPVISNDFPIANQRIQSVMNLIRKILNGSFSNEFSTIKQHLTSVSFSCAWRDSKDADCLVTLFYDTRIDDEIKWKDEATRLHYILGITQLTGRSRKQIIRAIENRNAIVRDTLWLVKQQNEWRVFLTDPSESSALNSESWIRKVCYEKPEGAFFHPNATAMCSALEWLIRRVDYIQQCNAESSHRKTRLVELYCGCGAHTVALMRTQALESIVAVELDERLVSACQRNVEINDIENNRTAETRTIVQVVSDDAGIWAKAFMNSGTGSCSSIPCKADSQNSNPFDILLVDPPRQGLDENVCHMVNNGSFKDLLYISCGKDALIRDLNYFSRNFDVIGCKLIDLFPQTNAVESLMHLRRKPVRASLPKIK